MSVGIYWDYQNVMIRSSDSGMILVDRVVEFAREHGTIGKMRAYANWSLPSIKTETAQNLASAGFELIQVPFTRKNAVDLAFSTDLGTAALEPQISTFVLITSDGDFLPALSALRRAGKRTVIVANPEIAIK